MNTKPGEQRSSNQGNQQEKNPADKMNPQSQHKGSDQQHKGSDHEHQVRRDNQGGGSQPGGGQGMQPGGKPGQHQDKHAHEGTSKDHVKDHDQAGQGGSKQREFEPHQSGKK